MTDHLVDPDQFIITRKRKKYRFAKFANASNCYELADWQAACYRPGLEQITQQSNQSSLNPTTSLAQGQSLSKSTDAEEKQVEIEIDLKDREIVVEIGAGTGLFSVELARRHPERLYLAVDVKADRLQKGAYKALEDGIDNVLFIRARADQLGEIVPPNSVSQIWLTFPDPFPRDRSAGRRLTHSNYLKTYATALKNPRRQSSNREKLVSSDGLYLKHDNPAFFQWSLEQLVATGWSIDELSFDLHESDLADDYKILTTYEQRWLDEGRITGFVRSRPVG